MSDDPNSPTYASPVEEALALLRVVESADLDILNGRLAMDAIEESSSAIQRAITVLEGAAGAHVEAFRQIRERIGQDDVPIHVAADIEQIICETGGDWPEE